jgi:hypothetical protein
MPRIAVVVHDDLGCHRCTPTVGRQIKTMLLMPDNKESSAAMIGLPDRVSATSTKFRKFGLISYNGHIEVNSACWTRSCVTSPS